MTGLAKNRKVAKKLEKKVAILMDKLSRIGKVAEFREINFRERPNLDFSRDKLSRKRAKFAKLAKVYLAKVNPVKVHDLCIMPELFNCSNLINNTQKFNVKFPFDLNTVGFI